MNGYTGSSELEGETVVFAWEEDGETYAVSSEDVDEELLEELRFDYDYAALLPGESVSEDDEWFVDVDEFRSLMDPWAVALLAWRPQRGSILGSRCRRYRGAEEEGCGPVPRLSERANPRRAL